MSADAETGQALRRYLLGTLPEEERQRLEERLLTDPPFIEELLLAEDELIDEHLAGRLSAAEAESFTRYFLANPQRQTKVQFARAFRRYVAAHAPAAEAPVADEAAAASEAPPMAQAPITAETPAVNDAPGPAPPPVLPTPVATPVQPAPSAPAPWSLRALFRRYNPGFAFALVAALLLVVAGLTWVTIRPRPPRQVVAVLLTQGLTRDTGQVPQLALAPGTDAAELRLELPRADYPAYTAELQTPEGRTLYTAADLTPTTLEGRAVVLVTIPARLLPAGDYQLRLTATTADRRTEPAGRYYFRITST